MQNKKIIDSKFIDGSFFDTPSYWIYLYDDGTVENVYINERNGEKCQ